MFLQILINYRHESQDLDQTFDKILIASGPIKDGSKNPECVTEALRIQMWRLLPDFVHQEDESCNIGQIVSLFCAHTDEQLKADSTLLELVSYNVLHLTH